jgi:hypothetical protein
MLLWTNEPVFSGRGVAPPGAFDTITRSVELFLCSFRDRRLHEHVCGDCDIALLSEWRQSMDGVIIEPMALRLVVPRDPGTYDVIREWWHVSTSHDYPHTGYTLTRNSFCGFQAALEPGLPNTRRYALRHVPQFGPDGAVSARPVVDAIDIWATGYSEFMSRAYQRRLTPFAVTVDDLRKLIKVAPVDHFFKHQPFSLEPEYSLDEYLVQGVSP